MPRTSDSYVTNAAEEASIALRSHTCRFLTCAQLHPLVDNSSALREFAIDVTKQISTTARGLGQGQKAQASAQFCLALSSALSTLRDELAAGEPFSESRLQTVIKNLERLCKPKQICNGCSNQAVAVPSRSKDANVNLSAKYPSLSCNYFLSHAKDGVRRVAVGRNDQAKRKQCGILHMLQNCNNQSSAGRQMPGKVVREQQAGDYLTDSIRTLYEVLSNQAQCTSGDYVQTISAMLRLWIGDDYTIPAFDMMFLTHPHNKSLGDVSRWRDARILVSTSRETKSEGLSEAMLQRLKQPNRIKSFCDQISIKNPFQLSLALLNDQLQFIERQEATLSWVSDLAPVPLRTIIMEKELPNKGKYHLSYLLANYFWQFYETGWIDRDWTRNIHFMFAKRDDQGIPGIYLNEPFISACFNPVITEEGFETGPHKLPKIKSLGIALLEIELGTTIDKFHDRNSYDGDGVINDADLYTALKLLSDPKTLDNTFEPLKIAIKECLRPCNISHLGLQSENAIRTFLKERVVDPLYGISSLYGNLNEVKIYPITMEPACPSAVSSPLVARVGPFERENAVKIPIGQTRKSNVGSTQTSTDPDSKSWLDELDKLNYVLCHDKKDRGYRKVRITVIDTGIDENDPCSRIIKDYKDFINPDCNIKHDNTGHGTNSVKLVFNVFSDAEVYVARVFRETEADENTHVLMEKAVRHAHDVWKSDVISIASGFENDYRPLRQALDLAAAAGVIIVAAASNHGNVREVVFPARMMNVICVFCTDARAKISASINPAPQKNKLNFAFLGEKVEIPPDDGIYVTGTSVATSIAAGVAGRLLDFSRPEKIQQNIRRVEELRSVAGMTSVFTAMTKGGSDQGYNCVVPWRLLQHIDDNLDKDSQRIRVCEKLSVALENIDLA